MPYQTLKVARDGRGVLTVALNRPDIRNAFNEAMIEELTRAFSSDCDRPSPGRHFRRLPTGMLCPHRRSRRTHSRAKRW